MKEFNSSRSFKIFAKTIRYENRYFYNQEIHIFLNTLIQTRQSRILKVEKDTIYWRAQLGCQLIPRYEDGKHNYDIQFPFPIERMKPIPNQAKEGRANPSGIPYLYLATDKNTALAEVRPWVGSDISLARLRTTKKMSLIDFSNDNFDVGYILGNSSPEIKDKYVWSDIGNAYSRPITSEESSTDYIPTQIISELFRNHGYDGIKYKSNLGKGFNVALFNLDSAEILDCNLYQLDRLGFKFSKISSQRKTIIKLRNSKI